MLWVELFDLVPDATDPIATLQASVMICLASDRQARDDDVLPEGYDRSGWWADPTFGSRLWLLRRSPLTDAVVAKAKEYATEALQDLVTDGLFSSFEVETARNGDALGMSITIYRDGQTPALLTYQDLWASLGG
jgi:phage gp46-like protein